MGNGDYQDVGRTLVPALYSDIFDDRDHYPDARLRTSDFYMSLSQGKYERYGSQFKFGRNPAVGVSEEVVWDLGGNYVFLDAAEQMSVVSTSTDDTNGGSGAWNLIMYGLDENFNDISETIVLNGTTPVISVNSYRRLFRAFVLQSGLATAVQDANLGDITFTSVSTATPQAAILQYNGQTLMAVYTTPANTYGYVTGLSLNVGQGKQCLFRAKFRNCQQNNCAFTTKYAIDVYQNTFFGELRVPFRVPPLTDMVITAQMSATPDATVTASFGVILEDVS